MAYKYVTSTTGNYRLLKEFAKKNRQNPTVEERVLWQYLRCKQLGANFRRQHPIGYYIADFVCLEKQLVIEVDGGYHFRGQIPKNDAERTRVLNEMGYDVIRFTNEEVLNNIKGVLSAIMSKLE